MLLTSGIAQYTMPIVKEVMIVFIIATIAVFSSCSKSDSSGGNPQNGLDQFVVVTNITTSSPATGYVGTFKDLAITIHTNVKARQSTQYPFVEAYRDYVFVLPNKGGDVVKKYKRQPDGSLSDEGSISITAF